MDKESAKSYSCSRILNMKSAPEVLASADGYRGRRMRPGPNRGARNGSAWQKAETPRSAVTGTKFESVLERITKILDVQEYCLRCVCIYSEDYASPIYSSAQAKAPLGIYHWRRRRCRGRNRLTATALGVAQVPLDVFPAMLGERAGVPWW